MMRGMCALYAVVKVRIVVIFLCSIPKFINFVGASGVVSTLDLWFHAFSNGAKLVIWQLVGIALAWTIRRLRNR